MPGGLQRLPPGLEGRQPGLRRQHRVDRHPHGPPQGILWLALGHQPGARLRFERRELRRGPGRAELVYRALLPRVVLLALGALVGRGALGGRLGSPRALRVIRRQGAREVLQDAAEDLRLVVRLRGRLVGKGEGKVGFGRAMLRQELRGVRQFFGRRGDLGESDRKSVV